MAGKVQLRDKTLLDALEEIEPVMFEDTVWRVTRENRDPCQCSRSGGRWDDGTFNVLYTAESCDGAIAEMYFHLSKGQPIIPSQVSYKPNELAVSLSRALKLVNIQALEALGLNTARYSQLSYQERETLYPSSQNIAESAHFLDYDGLIVPSARWQGMNIVLFCEKLSPDQYQVIQSHEIIDWSAWAKNNQFP